MKRILAFVCLAWFVFATSQGMGQQFITPERAKEAVRAFEGKPDLEFSRVELQHDTSGPSWSHRSWYSLHHKDFPNTRHRWSVDARTGEVTSAYYDDAYPATHSSDPFGPLTKEQCRQIAENFARAKYQGFDQMGLQLIAEEWMGEGWRFEWRQKVAFGALAINGVEVEVNPANGRIQSYSSDRITTLPPREPKLTKEQVIERAKEATGIVTVDWFEEPQLLADPLGNVYWGLALGGGDAQGKYRGYAVTLNAETGEVLSKAPQMGVAESVIPSHLRPVKQGRWLLVGTIAIIVLAIGTAIIKLRRLYLMGKVSR